MRVIVLNIVQFQFYAVRC